jgi:TRAP-type C4-dicarboxylate transport system permease large subunit
MRRTRKTRFHEVQIALMVTWMLYEKRKNWRTSEAKKMKSTMRMMEI